jgi:hypothetical protein
MTSTGTRKSLTLHEKLNLINGSPFKKQKDLASEYGISIGSVSNILKSKDETVYLVKTFMNV